jgi:NADP-dependent 3-hydroxy acid dehydrogenase YdfG
VLTLDIDADAVAAFESEFGAGTASLCDVSDAGQVEAAWSKLMASSNRVDLLFNNAGIAGPQQPVEDIEVAAWQRQSIPTSTACSI